MSRLKKLFSSRKSPPEAAARATAAPTGPDRVIVSSLSELAGHDDCVVAIGQFDVTSGELLACDSAPHADMKADDPHDLGHPQVLFLSAARGTWRAFVSFTPASEGRPAALIVQHESRPGHPDAVLSGSRVGDLVVEGGRVAIADSAVRQNEETCKDFIYEATESVISNVGCMCQSGWGDGTFPVFAAKDGETTVALAVVFSSGEADDPDQSSAE